MTHTAIPYPQPRRRQARAARVGALLAGLAVLLLAGCGGPVEVPDYDRDPTLLLLEFLDAAKATDHDLAASKIAHLGDWRPMETTYRDLQRHYEENAVTVKANAALAAGDLDSARQILRQAMLRQDNPRRLRLETDRLDAVARVRDYIARKTHVNPDVPRSAATAGAALKDLPMPAVIGVDMPAYSRWLNAQSIYVSELARAELDARRDELLRRLESALLLRDATAARKAAGDLAAQFHSEPVQAAWPRRVAGDFSVEEAAAMPDGQARELGLLLLWQRSPSLAMTLIDQSGAFSSTYAGRYLVAIRLAHDGDTLTAAEHLQALDRDLPGIDVSPAAIPLALDLRNHGGARPSLPSALRLIYRLQTPPTP